MHVRIFRTASGAVTVAMIFMRPPQRVHLKTSTANTRLRAGFAGSVATPSVTIVPPGSVSSQATTPAHAAHPTAAQGATHGGT